MDPAKAYTQLSITWHDAWHVEDSQQMPANKYHFIIDHFELRGLAVLAVSYLWDKV